MGQIEDVLDGVRRELGGEGDVRDVRSAVDAMVRAFRQVATSESALSGSAVARMLGVSRQAVNQRAGRGSLIVIADRDGVRYPTWQFRDGSPVRGLIPLVRAARDAGVDDAALASWIESDAHRIASVVDGRAELLIPDVSEARLARTAVTRRRAPGRATRLTDTPAG